MNIMRITGLVLIGACVVFLFAAIAIGDKLTLFIIAMVLGIIGNVLWWLGRPHHEADEDSPEAQPDDQKPDDQPPAS